MALPLHTTVVISTEASQEKSGPTIVHSTGVKDYRVQPELISILQVSCTNEKLSDHEKGVQCVHPAAHIVGVLNKAGFNVTAQASAGGRKLWILTKTGEAGHSNDAEHGAAEPGDEEEHNEDEEAAGEEED